MTNERRQREKKYQVFPHTDQTEIKMRDEQHLTQHANIYCEYSHVFPVKRVPRAVFSLCAV